MNLVNQYWAGVRQRLRAEVDVFAGLVSHNGEKGRENEAAFARILESFVPDRYGVGTGLLIDRFGKASRQTDIVLFEQVDEPKILAQTNQLLFPVENVVAVIEIKTRLTREEIEDCETKRESIQELDSHTAEYPVFALLAYKTEVAPETTASDLASHSKDGQIDLGCILDAGLLSGTASLLRQPGVPATDFMTGAALVRNDDDTDWVSVNKAPRGMRERRGDADYAVTKINSKLVLVDEARALLLFVEALSRAIAIRTNRAEPVMSSYLDDDSRRLVRVT